MYYWSYSSAKFFVGWILAINISYFWCSLNVLHSAVVCLTEEMKLLMWHIKRKIHSLKQNSHMLLLWFWTVQSRALSINKFPSKAETRSWDTGRFVPEEQIQECFSCEWETDFCGHGEGVGHISWFKTAKNIIIHIPSRGKSVDKYSGQRKISLEIIPGNTIWQCKLQPWFSWQLFELLLSANFDWAVWDQQSITHVWILLWADICLEVPPPKKSNKLYLVGATAVLKLFFWWCWRWAGGPQRQGGQGWEQRGQILINARWSICVSARILSSWKQHIQQDYTGM